MPTSLHTLSKPITYKNSFPESLPGSLPARDHATFFQTETAVVSQFNHFSHVSTFLISA
jgi:hypothetical protein